jgi:hypothetical protein
MWFSMLKAVNIKNNIFLYEVLSILVDMWKRLSEPVDFIFRADAEDLVQLTN